MFGYLFSLHLLQLHQCAQVLLHASTANVLSENTVISVIVSIR